VPCGAWCVVVPGAFLGTWSSLIALTPLLNAVILSAAGRGLTPTIDEWFERMTLVRLVSRGAALSWRDRWRLLRVLGELLTIEVMVRFVPLPHAASALGIAFGTSDDALGPCPPSLSSSEQRMVQVLGWVMPHWPFADGPCLRQALVAGHLLRRHRPRLLIGAARRDGAVVAHAWLQIGGVVLGGADGYVPLVTAAELRDQRAS